MLKDVQGVNSLSRMEVVTSDTWDDWLRLLKQLLIEMKRSLS